MIQIKARSGGGVSIGQQFCTGRKVGVASSHEKCPGWTLPGYMAPPPLRQRVGLLPISIEGHAAGQPSEGHSLPAAARNVWWLCMLLPSWCRQPGQQAPLVTGEPHFHCGAGVTIITPASSYEESWEITLQWWKTTDRFILFCCYWKRDNRFTQEDLRALSTNAAETHSISSSRSYLKAIIIKSIIMVKISNFLSMYNILVSRRIYASIWNIV